MTKSRKYSVLNIHNWGITLSKPKKISFLFWNTWLISRPTVHEAYSWWSWIPFAGSLSVLPLFSYKIRLLFHRKLEKTKKKEKEGGRGRNEAELSLKSDSNVKDNVFHSWNTHNYIRNIIIIDCVIWSSSSRMPAHTWLKSFIFELRCVLIRKMYNDVLMFLLSRILSGILFYVIFLLVRI